MAHPDPGPLLDEHLDELELIVRASENNGEFAPGTRTGAGYSDGQELIDDMNTIDYVLWWHDRHDRKLLEAARWALAQGWARGQGRCRWT